jgi:hypothetical protein
MTSLKISALLPVALLSFNAAALCLSPKATLAANFDQTEVNQGRFVAVAVPRGNNYYNLTILEQVSDQRRCWQESGNSPTIIEPLLLQFNFSGICGRNSDSNGYSIRHKGSDLALQYRLSLQPRGNEVVLLGMPASASQGTTPVVLGRTRGLSSSLMKINLDPGWKFTKRSYQGKTLGHIYLTHEGTLPMGGTTKAPFVGKTQAVSPARSSASGQQTVLGSIAKASSSNRFYRLYVKTYSSAQERLVRSLVPGSFRSAYQGQSVMQVGLFSSPEKARSLEGQLNRKGLKTALIEEKGSIPVVSSPSAPSVFPAVASGPVLGVPSSPAPLGNARGEGDVYGNGNTLTPPPPPNPSLALAKRYRVLVPAASASQQSRIRSLVRDAFRSSYQGQSVMQVGSFTDMSEAQSVMQLMQRNGFRTVID